MQVEVVDGRWVVDAEWLDEPVTGDTWLDVYWTAVKKRTLAE